MTTPSRGMTSLRLFLVLAAGGAGCAAGGAPAVDRELAVEVADRQVGLVAAMSVDGEAIAIESTTRGEVRLLQVTGEDGASYAAWRMQIADSNTDGSYGGRRFGRAVDADTDGDTGAWAAVLDGRAGQVLAAVSAGAERALADPSLAEVAGDLVALSRMHPSLVLLAGRGAPGAIATPSSSCGTSLANTSLVASAYYDPEIGTCRYWKEARTYRPSGCTRNYYLQLYRIEGAFPGSYLCGDGTGDGPTGYAECIHVGYGRGYYAWRSKHWDQLNPGYPVWRNTARTC